MSAAQGRIVPFRDLAEIDAGDDVAGELQLAGLHAVQVHHRGEPADDDRELGKIAFRELFRRQRRVAGGEIDLGLGEPHDAAERTDGLIVDAELVGDEIAAAGAEFQKALRPGADDRVREGRARALHALGHCRRGANQPCKQHNHKADETHGASAPLDRWFHALPHWFPQVQATVEVRCDSGMEVLRRLRNES